MRIGILCILLCGRLAAQSGASLEGTAVDSATHQPLPGVHITLRTDGDETWGAMSGKDGRFAVSNLPPRDYSLGAQHNGYVYLPGKNAGRLEAAEIVLKEGEHLTGFTVAMTQRASISGRVIDEYGDPVQNAEVHAVPVTRGEQSERFGMEDRTDERGQFRVSGAPGKFFLKVTSRERASVEVRSDGEPAVYSETYYPSTASRDLARAIEVAAGREATGMDVRLVQALSLKISGIVSGIPKGTMAMVRVTLEGGDAPSFSKWGRSDGEGKFIVSGLQPGSYRVSAFDGAMQLRSSLVKVRLDAADADGVNLRVAPAEQLSGTVVIDGDSAKSPAAENLTVEFEPRSGDVPRPQGGDVDRDGTFRLERVFPDTFRVSVEPMLENSYIKSVTLGGVESRGEMVDLTGGVGSATAAVVLSLNGAAVQGTVTDADGKPIGSPLPFVILATENPGDGIQGRTDLEAKFRYTGLRPGKYRLIAVDPREFDGNLSDIEETLAKAPQLELREGDRIVKDLKLTSLGNPDAKP